MRTARIPRPIRPKRLKDQDGRFEPDLVRDAGQDGLEEKWAGEYTSIYCSAVHVCMHKRGSGIAARGREVISFFAFDPAIRNSENGGCNVRE